MSIPTIAVTIRTTGQDGMPMIGAPVVARLMSTVIYQGYTMPEIAEGVTDTNGLLVLHLWPNALGVDYSEYKFSIGNTATGKMKNVYAFLPNRDCNLWDLTTSDTPNQNTGSTPGSGNGNSGGVQMGSITVGSTNTGTPGTPASVTNAGTTQDVILNFTIPQGLPGRDGTNGLNGTGTMVVGSVATLPPGSAATVVNVGTDAQAILNFGIPQGVPGVSATPGGGTGGGTAETYVAAYPWESGGTGGNTGGGGTPTPVATIFDAATQADYTAAINAASTGSKRLAGANTLIAEFGSSQTLTLTRNGVTVLSAGFTTPLSLFNNGIDIGAKLGAIASQSSVTAADLASGTWRAVLSSGSRTATLTVGPANSGAQLVLDAAPAPGNGFAPSIVFLVPRSVDGLV